MAEKMATIKQTKILNELNSENQELLQTKLFKKFIQYEEKTNKIMKFL